ncbi:MAG: alpha/beta hydrolase [Magnetococcales bacterium]|nr:alpha/beta hydrolase [Magnetococcales bacterium]
MPHVPGQPKTFYADIDLKTRHPPTEWFAIPGDTIQKGDKVLVLVHGYNNDFQEVMSAYDLLENKFNTICPGRYDRIIGFIWPGGDHKLEYFSARRRCPESSLAFEELITSLKALNCSVGVSAHSMGCRVILGALDRMASLSSALLPDNMEIFVSAAAVDNEKLEPNEDYYKLTGVQKPIYVFHSKNDPVLKMAYTLAQMDLALGLTGPENPGAIRSSVAVVNCKKVIFDHGEYKQRDQWYAFINGMQTWTIPTQPFHTL